MSAGRGGAGRGQGRKTLAPTDSTERITITLLNSQLEYLGDNKSEAIRRMIEQANRPTVTLWEDNAGGLWLVDKARHTAFDASLFDTFLPDAEALYDERLESDGGSYPYSEAVEQWPETQLVAEYDGERVILYPDKMGYAAKRYCGIKA